MYQFLFSKSKISNRPLTFVVFFILFCLSVFVCLNAFIPIAHAAPLTYSANTTISLTSPSTTLTIATGSVADTLQVNTTSVIVTLSSSTGGSFTLIAATPYDLSIESSSVGGVVSLSCIAGIASITITQSTGSTLYTIVPTTPQCTAANTPSPVVNVAGSYGVPYFPGVGIITSSTIASSSSETTPITPSSSSIASLTFELTVLQAQLAALLQQTGRSAVAPISIPANFIFTRGLSLNMTSNDVKQLQTFLTKNPVLYPEGKITGYFGTLTRKAVQRFQKKYGLAKPGQSVYGYVGPATRVKLNVLLRQGLTP